ncbi:hypothetical protein M5225_001438 [Vibrio vulnificus]|nr:hypothetical protein [Vibrio vulnificus]EIA1334474.1 hypothetical protein [Vibrio vulnificus]EIA1770368.1 hypothetical protein [Vibrio vulnificus]EIU7593432.1 hypothetical protein [Vibrio vulnificus]EIX4867331.1 hypothetical protein [Vibrio vulnificus]
MRVKPSQRPLILLLILLSSTGVAGVQSGSYPSLAQARLGTHDHTVSSEPNALLHAIEQGHAIPLKFDAQFKANSPYLFPSRLYQDEYWRQKAINVTWLKAMQQLVSEFACAEYRYRHRLIETQQCYQEQAKHQQQPKEGMPFFSGQFLQRTLEINQDNRFNQVSYQMWLPSGEQESLRSVLGSVHELGTFFGRLADHRSLVLSIRVNVYQLSNEGGRGDTLTRAPMLYFVLLPTAKALANQPTQREAALYAWQQARVILVGKP